MSRLQAKRAFLGDGTELQDAKLLLPMVAGEKRPPMHVFLSSGRDYIAGQRLSPGLESPLSG